MLDEGLASLILTLSLNESNKPKPDQVMEPSRGRRHFVCLQAELGYLHIGLYTCYVDQCHNCTVMCCIDVVVHSSRYGDVCRRAGRHCVQSARSSPSCYSARGRHR